MREKIFWVLQLTHASHEDAKEIVKIHNNVFGTEDFICSSCPEQFRKAVERLRNYYEREYKGVK